MFVKCPGCSDDCGITFIVYVEVNDSAIFKHVDSANIYSQEGH